MLVYNLQMFGGRGAGYADGAPSGGGGGSVDQNWGARYGNVYKQADTLKEALGDKHAPISTDEALRNVNPNRNKTMNYGEFTENCQRCVVAYEMQRRGYEVEALPTSKNDKMGAIIAVRQGSKTVPVTNGTFSKAFRGAKTIGVGASTAAKAQKNAEKEMKSWGNGARGVVFIKGHVFNAEVKNGKVFYVDAQIGKRYHAEGIFSRTDPKHVMVMRTDNLKVSERAKELVKHVKKNNK